jgi:site-specific DNA-methyltransferase (cytosine-N4-specific)
MGWNLPKVEKKRQIESCSDTISRAYSTDLGTMYVGTIENALDTNEFKELRGRVNLIVTSPPFPLVRKKQYGNETGDSYLNWLRGLAPHLTELLTPDGSIVLEIGNAWEEGVPVMSTLPLEALMAFKQAANLHLCQHVICHNPARLPGPAAWVTVKRARLKDTYTHVWWMSRSHWPKADNRRVLAPYSADMKKLLVRKHYNSGKRPSGHVISEKGFLQDHGGAISANVIDLDPRSEKLPSSLLKFTGTMWEADYRAYCKKHNVPAHPARMQQRLVSFFVNFLTDTQDLVVDPFAGSNTTGAIAEAMSRRWMTVEARSDYAIGSKGRFRQFLDVD